MGNERRAVSRLKRFFNRVSAKAEGQSSNESGKAAGHASPHPKSVAGSITAASITDQSTTDSSVVISAPSEKTPHNRSVEVTGKETPTGLSPAKPLVTDVIYPLPTPALWDKAYDSLKQEKPKLLCSYEDLLSRVLMNAKSSLSAPDQGDDAEDIRNQIPQHDAIARQEKMKRIAELGLKHMEDKKVKVTILGHEIGLQDGAAQVGEAVDWAQNYVKDAIKDVPYAPAVMAGISLVLPLLKNPTAADAANREGFTYVTSQMRYYVEMESLLLPEDMKPALKNDLMERVVKLYTLIIDFQVQSVIRFYRSRTNSYFRGVVNYDSWNDTLCHLKAEESNLEEKFEKVLSASSVQQLKKLASEANSSRKALNDILDNIQELVRMSRNQKDILERTEQRLSNAEDQRCRDTLQATDPSLDKARIEEDKGGLLRDSYCWVLDHVDFQRWRNARCGQLLWIKGDPGKGKTMLICGIIDELSKMANDANISFFFCQAANSRINNAAAVLRGLIYMLVQQQPSLITHIRDGFFEGENAWYALLRAFTKILEDPHLKRTYLIVDALDECTEDLDRLLKLLSQKSSARSHVKWVVTSRNWPSIEKDLNDTTQMKLRLELNADTLSAAVGSFIEHKLNELAKKNRYSTEIRDVVQHHLKSNANGTFLWVALVCKELADVSKRHVRKKLQDFPPGLDELYKRMLDQISESDDAELCKSLLGVITTVFRPITFDELSACLDIPEEADDSDLAEIVGLCGSFLTLRGRTISLVHQSAKDFLLREAFHEIIRDGQEKLHYSIFSKSLRAIARTLRRDIYNLVHPGYPIDKVRQPDPDPLAVIRYACIYWVDHLDKCSPDKNATEDLQENSLVGDFFRQDYLHWLEALSLSRSLSDGVVSMTMAQDAQLIDRVRDAYRFIRYHKTAIEDQPLQVYASGMVFSPKSSTTRIQFETQEPGWIIRKPILEDGWSACLQTLEEHSGPVNSVVFSHDSKLLASASDDSTVKVWDASSGHCLQTLEEHSGPVNSVVFSHDYRLLASASDDSSVKVWDVSSGQCVQTLEDNSSAVNSVVFSHDSKILASALADGIVKVWDASSSQCLQILQDSSKPVRSVIFSHNSKVLAFASDDFTIKMWNASSGQGLQTLEGHSSAVNSVVFSHDSKIITSASSDSIIKLWDVSSGHCLRTLKGHNGSVNSVVFSHDSKLLASASYDFTVKVWDASSGHCLRTFEGHIEWVSSVVFSHDLKFLASASYDSTVKIWDVSSGHYPQSLNRHKEWVNSVVFSHDSKLLASASYDSTIKVWNTSSGHCLQTLKGHSGPVNSVVFSHDSRLLASASHDHTVKVWDTSSGQCLQTLNVGRTTSVKSFANNHSYLETDNGNLCLSLVSDIGSTNTTDPSVPRFEGYGISLNGKYITWNSQNLLRLPPEYRPLLRLPPAYRAPTYAVSQSTICLGCTSGLVLFFTFDSLRLPHLLARQ
ncbi:uncharacterized protein N7469_009401 [Penicillium citrinum]|uniref:NACHT domain-containing protein n=1 Tax=Penicillium citrinum TaxID=5077 RepID=A0A9W9THP8_PENCI|nr:uncharacterized protein N7469_009401 [Penicillium citrinum]KAJ5223161.1 hypothetical protein N7469_009401 [Penicillium citrinum]